MREKMYSILHLDKTKETPENKQKKLVVISKRIDFNSEEVKNLIEQKCENCKIEIMKCKGNDYICKIKQVSSASLFIARTGSDAESVFWMKENSSFLEISPFSSSDKRFETLSDLANVKYFRYMNKEIPKLGKASDRDCYLNEKIMKTTYCQNLINEESVFVNTTNFLTFWEENIQNII